jgi:hypothetical protein
LDTRLWGAHATTADHHGRAAALLHRPRGRDGGTDC